MTLRSGSSKAATAGDSSQKDLHVVLGAGTFYPIYSGPGLRFQRYAPGLRQRGIHLRVVTKTVTEESLSRDGSVAGSQPMPTEQVADELLDGLPIHRVDLSRQRRQEARFFAAIERQAARVDLQASVVQLLDVRPSAALPLWRLRRKGIRSIFTHTLLGDLSTGFWRRQLQRAARRLPLELVDRLIVSSGVMKDRLRELGVRTPVEVIPNGVDLQQFRPPTDQGEIDALRAKLGLGLDWTVVLAVGPIIPRKGADVLIDAFTALAARHPRARLVMVGPRHDLVRTELQGFRARIDAMLRERSAANKVIFTGPVSNVDEYLRCADILVFPSLREGMPNVPLEAMASRVPVIMTPFVGMPSEFGSAGKDYILSDCRPDSLSRDIESLLESPDSRRQLGENGRWHVQNSLALEHSLDAYARVYRALSVQR